MQSERVEIFGHEGKKTAEILIAPHPISLKYDGQPRMRKWPRIVSESDRLRIDPIAITAGDAGARQSG
jgi:hypothetical protein